LAEPSRIDATIKDPLVERLLVAYVLARVDDVVNGKPIDEYGGPAPDAGVHDGKFVPNPVLANLAGAIVKAGLDHPAGADRVAALAYRLGRYDVAERMADRSGSALALWIKAKIALQKGDLAAAQRDYASASHAFSSDLEKDGAVRLIGESGTLALARGDYLMALDQLYPVAGVYWGDVEHIADRVLTIDELKDFVDAKTKAQPAGAPEHCGGWGGDANPASRIRDLLARRLMREGRFDEALPHFCAAKTRDDAEAYAALLREGASDWGRVDRAEALFKASVLARESGMEIMGTEAAPDYEDLEGSFDLGVGQSELKGPYVSKMEHARFAASAAKPDFRFHYRFIAADEAAKAADLLPPRSQAFAAVLCSATGWMLETADGDAPSRAKALYRRYVHQGALVPWAKDFGRHCPNPDFASAIKRERLESYRATRHFASRHRWELAGGGAALMAATPLLVFRRRIAKSFGGRRHT
jgi:tetratricopeptide (TPR) repeat protein